MQILMVVTSHDQLSTIGQKTASSTATAEALPTLLV